MYWADFSVFLISATIFHIEISIRFFYLIYLRKIILLKSALPYLQFKRANSEIITWLKHLGFWIIIYFSQFLIIFGIQSLPSEDPNKNTAQSERDKFVLINKVTDEIKHPHKLIQSIVFAFMYLAWTIAITRNNPNPNQYKNKEQDAKFFIGLEDLLK
jgi:hypothetical protein